MCDTFYQRDSKLFAEHTQAFKKFAAGTPEINIMDSIIKPAVCVTASVSRGLLLSSAQGSGKAFALTIIITVNAAVYSFC